MQMKIANQKVSFNWISESIKNDHKTQWCEENGKIKYKMSSITTCTIIIEQCL